MTASQSLLPVINPQPASSSPKHTISYIPPPPSRLLAAIQWTKEPQDSALRINERVVDGGGGGRPRIVIGNRVR